MKTVINIALIITMLEFVSVQAQPQSQYCYNSNAIPTTPRERFIDNGDGTVSDKRTGLIWMRCALGQAWDQLGQTCTGEAIEYNWQQALQAADGYVYAGSNTWRVPDLMQLQSIVERTCYYQMINLDVFPQSPAGSFWTASPDVGRNSYAWSVCFCQSSFTYNYPAYCGSGKNGGSRDMADLDYMYVRLVRSNQ